MFANVTFAIIYEIHRITMVIETLAAGLLLYLILILMLRSNSWVLVRSLWTTRQSSLEFVWTIIPACLIICLINLAIIGIYSTLDIIDVNSSYDVLGFQWYWSINKVDATMVSTNLLDVGGLRLLETSNWLVLPINTAVRIYLSAFDVIHSFSVPSLGVKADCTPGRLTSVTLLSNLPGIFYGQCSELCGSLHGFMPIKLEFR